MAGTTDGSIRSARAMAAYPSGLIPPPARWKGEARHVAVADYEPEGLDVLMRLYYPTHERPPARWRRPLWVPTLAYSHGMMHFLFDFGDPKRSWWQRLLARAAYIGGHVATTLFDTLPVKENAVPRSEKTMPVVIFSHGLAGTRNMYAALCTSLASQGFLVAALEHRDGSASCASKIDDAGGVKHEPYVHTDGNFAWRREQIDRRVREFSAAADALSRSPAPPRNVFPGSRFDPGTLAGLLDTSRLTAAGHSFGGATVLAALSSVPSVKRAVLLDPWAVPFGPFPETAALKGAQEHPLRVAARAGVPTFVMNSHGWDNVSDMAPLYRHAEAPWMECSVGGTRHQDFSDLPFRMPTLASQIGMKGKVNLHRLFDLKLGLLDVFFENVESEDASGLESAVKAYAEGYRDEMQIRLKCAVP